MISLDDQGRNILLSKYNFLIDKIGYCKIDQYIREKGLLLADVKYMAGNGGGYNPFTNEIIFEDNSQIDANFPEEFVHLFQNAYYEGGSTQYVTYLNLEFEAKVIVGILCTKLGLACPLMGKTSENAERYEEWIYALTNYGDKLPKSSEIFADTKYQIFMNDFKMKPGYNRPINTSISPVALKYIFDNPVCN